METSKGTRGILPGVKISEVYTNHNAYQAWIEVMDKDDNVYRMHASELLKVIKKVKFKTEKKVKHTWLTI